MCGVPRDFVIKTRARRITRAIRMILIYHFCARRRRGFRRRARQWRDRTEDGAGDRWRHGGERRKRTHERVERRLDRICIKRRRRRRCMISVRTVSFTVYGVRWFFIWKRAIYTYIRVYWLRYCNHRGPGCRRFYSVCPHPLRHHYRFPPIVPGAVLGRRFPWPLTAFGRSLRDCEQRQSATRCRVSTDHTLYTRLGSTVMR